MSALRVLVQQPVVPEYRRAFFTALDQLCRLTVVAGNHSVDAGLQQSIAPGPGWLDLRAPTVFPGGIHHLSLRAIDIPRYDVIIVNFNPRHTASIRLYRAARRHGCTLLWWNHLWSYTSTRRNLAIRRVLMNRCDGVVLYTDREARIGRAIGITPPVRGLNNCCHTDDALILRRAAIPEREREAHFLMLGRLTPKSRFDWVLQLAPAFEGRARFTMVGASPSQLQRFGNRPGDNIRLIAATYDEKEKVELLSAADYLVYPGPIGLGALEALSMGLP
ncbi:MAG: glycosyltransferase, partial [Gammaproteobacteria bacterium]|nr:glycosyltransferase [Gammaproteobacteria bacterium]